MKLKLGIKLIIPMIVVLVSSELFICCAIVQDIPIVIRHTFNTPDVHIDLKNIELGAATKPHHADWLQEHGMSARVKGTSKCSTCHGNDLDGGLAEVSCYMCHNNKWDMPHPSHWVEGHGKYLDMFGSSGCNECHDSDLKEARSRVSCNTCHGSYADLQQAGYGE